jgi:hypothetical protein
MTEEITVCGKNGCKTIVARIDTGATKSSIDSSLAKELDFGPAIKTKLVKSAHGVKERPVIEAKVKFAGKNKDYQFTVADRSHMRYKILIGRNILRHGFMIDPSKKGKQQS